MSKYPDNRGPEVNPTDTPPAFPLDASGALAGDNSGSSASRAGRAATVADALIHERNKRLAKSLPSR